MVFDLEGHNRLSSCGPISPVCSVFAQISAVFEKSVLDFGYCRATFAGTLVIEAGFKLRVARIRRTVESLNSARHSEEGASSEEAVTHVAPPGEISEPQVSKQDGSDHPTAASLSGAIEDRPHQDSSSPRSTDDTAQTDQVANDATPAAEPEKPSTATPREVELPKLPTPGAHSKSRHRWRAVAAVVPLLALAFAATYFVIIRHLWSPLLRELGKHTTSSPIAAATSAGIPSPDSISSTAAESIVGPRVALVIGNSKYQNVNKLQNPTNDARLMAVTLQRLGFTIVRGGAQIDLDKDGLERVLQQFSDQLQGASVALFYYAGHGVEVGGENYLVPISANLQPESDVKLQMLDAQVVLEFRCRDPAPSSIS